MAAFPIHSDHCNRIDGIVGIFGKRNDSGKSRCMLGIGEKLIKDHRKRENGNGVEPGFQGLFPLSAVLFKVHYWEEPIRKTGE